MAFLAIDGLICCLLVWRGEKRALASWLEAMGGGGCGAAGPTPELGSRLCTGPHSSLHALVSQTLAGCKGSKAYGTTAIEQWFSTLSAHGNHLGGLKSTEAWAPTPEILI